MLFSLATGARHDPAIAPYECKGTSATTLLRRMVTAFAPKIEAARPEDRPGLIAALLAVAAYHRVGDRPGRWEPRARKRRPKSGVRLNRTRAAAELPKNRKKWFSI